jgi:sugar lactone lactonase YvrE
VSTIRQLISGGFAHKPPAITLSTLLLLTSCEGPTISGLIMMTDHSYRATVFATNKIGFAAPDGIRWHHGKLYMADEGAAALVVWDAESGMKTLLGSQFGTRSPEDVVVDTAGNIFLSDDDAGGVFEVDAAGKRRLLAGKEKGLYSTEGIALAPDGSILVGDKEAHQVFKVSRDGDVSVFLGSEFGITKPESMTFDDEGNLYIGDNKDDVLYMLDTAHKLHRIIDGQHGLSPETIFNSRGSLYITDSKSGKLYLYTPDENLKLIGTFRGQLKNIQGVTVDEQGDIYVSVQSDLEHDVGYILKIRRKG